jgi:REP element-mobilizing transposase RayT
MAATKVPLESDHYYHIYNHAIGKENLFKDDSNYLFFLNRFKKWILPISRILSYCLMPNHFHFLLYIKNDRALAAVFDQKIRNRLNLPESFKFSNEVGTVRIIGSSNATASAIIERLIPEQFSHCFNSYVQAFNKVHDRKGALMKEGFQRKLIDSEEYMRKVICYIHNNPVNHGFVKNPEDWRFSSYRELFSSNESFIERREVMDLFDTMPNFLFVHRMYGDVDLEA